MEVQKFVLKIRHYVKKYIMTSEDCHDIKTSVVTSTLDHDVQKFVITLKICPNIK